MFLETSLSVVNFILCKNNVILYLYYAINHHKINFSLRRISYRPMVSVGLDKEGKCCFRIIWYRNSRLQPLT